MDTLSFWINVLSHSGQRDFRCCIFHLLSQFFGFNQACWILFSLLYCKVGPFSIVQLLPASTDGASFGTPLSFQLWILNKWATIVSRVFFYEENQVLNNWSPPLCKEQIDVCFLTVNMCSLHLHHCKDSVFDFNISFSFSMCVCIESANHCLVCVNVLF